MARITKRTPKKTALLLGKLAEGMSITAACKAAVIARSVYYQWRDEDAEFAALADEALEAGTDRLEDIANFRATRPIDGSDTLLIFLLKARRPEKYRDNSKVEISGPDGGPMQFAGVMVPLPTRDDEG